MQHQIRYAAKTVAADRKLTQVFYLPCPKIGQGKSKVITMEMLGRIRRMHMRDKVSLHENTGLTLWLFPATQAKKDQPDFADHVCVKTVTKQVGDRQRPGNVPMSGRSKDVDALVLPGGKWTPHDLRRTAATTMAELGALPDVVEKCLNHAEVGKVKRIYQRAQYEGPMRDAWKLLGSRLALLQDMAAGRVSNVVPMQRSR